MVIRHYFKIGIFCLAALLAENRSGAEGTTAGNLQPGSPGYYTSLMNWVARSQTKVNQTGSSQNACMLSDPVLLPPNNKRPHLSTPKDIKACRNFYDFVCKSKKSKTAETTPLSFNEAKEFLKIVLSVRKINILQRLHKEPTTDIQPVHRFIDAVEVEFLKKINALQPLNGSPVEVAQHIAKSIDSCALEKQKVGSSEFGLSGFWDALQLCLNFEVKKPASAFFCEPQYETSTQYFTVKILNMWLKTKKLKANKDKEALIKQIYSPYCKEENITSTTLLEVAALDPELREFLGCKNKQDPCPNQVFYAYHDYFDALKREKNSGIDFQVSPVSVEAKTGEVHMTAHEALEPTPVAPIDTPPADITSSTAEVLASLPPLPTELEVFSRRHEAREGVLDLAQQKCRQSKVTQYSQLQNACKNAVSTGRVDIDLWNGQNEVFTQDDYGFEVGCVQRCRCEDFKCYNPEATYKSQKEPQVKPKNSADARALDLEFITQYDESRNRFSIVAKACFLKAAPSIKQIQSQCSSASGAQAVKITDGKKVQVIGELSNAVFDFSCDFECKCDSTNTCNVEYVLPDPSVEIPQASSEQLQAAADFKDPLINPVALSLNPVLLKALTVAKVEPAQPLGVEATAPAVAALEPAPAPAQPPPALEVKVPIRKVALYVDDENHVFRPLNPEFEKKKKTLRVKELTPVKLLEKLPPQYEKRLKARTLLYDRAREECKNLQNKVCAKNAKPVLLTQEIGAEGFTESTDNAATFESDRFSMQFACSCNIQVDYKKQLSPPWTLPDKTIEAKTLDWKQYEPHAVKTCKEEQALLLSKGVVTTNCTAKKNSITLYGEAAHVMKWKGELTASYLPYTCDHQCSCTEKPNCESMPVLLEPLAP